MRYYKLPIDGYILIIGTGQGGVEITENEYNAILSVIRSKPADGDGYAYRLRTDLTWEQYELPPIEEEDEEATAEDYQEALAELGVSE